MTLQTGITGPGESPGIGTRSKVSQTLRELYWLEVSRL
jgi:hypothetical protein